MDLILRESYPLDTNEKQNINSKLDRLINESKSNSEIIQKLMSEAVSLATSVEARADGLKTQGLLVRLWNDITGANHHTSANNQKDLATAQYISQQLLVKMSEQNVITLDMVEELSKKVNKLAHRQVESENEIANINALLEHFFIKIRNRFDRVENQANLNSWTNYIVDHEILDDKTYCQLTLPARLMCLANEFFVLTKGRWDKKELAILKGTMRLVGVDPKEELAPIGIFQSYQESPKLLNKLIDNVVNYKGFIDNASGSTLLVGFTKIDHKRHENKEHSNELECLIGNKSADELEISAITKVLLQAADSKPTEPQSAFSIVEILLNDLKTIKKITREWTAEYVQQEQTSLEKQRKIEVQAEVDKGLMSRVISGLMKVKANKEQALKEVANTNIDILISECHQMHCNVLQPTPLKWEEEKERIVIFASDNPFALNDYECGLLTFNSLMLEDGYYIREGDCLGVLILMGKTRNHHDDCEYVYLYSKCSGFLVRQHVGNLATATDVYDNKVPPAELIIPASIKDDTVLMTLSHARSLQ